MAPRRKRQKKPPTSTAVSNPSVFTPQSNLTEDLILSILKRLPVKSILRFKCVSKEWLSLLSTPNFISMHREQTSSNPLNYSLIIHNFNDGKISLLNVNSLETEPISLVIPSPVMSKKMELVGSVNGLVCLNCLPPEHMIVLWNPAMNLYKLIRTPVDDTRTFSFGFAYDNVNDDHKIIRIDRLNKSSSANPELLFRSAGEVYSSNLDSWKRVQMDFSFVPIGRSIVTAKGIPYWSGLLIEESNQDKLTEVLVYYDTQNDLFKHVSVPKWAPHHSIGKLFLEWKGNVSMLVLSSLSKDKDKDYFIDILVFDEIGMCWKKISSHGPIGLKIERSVQCSKDWLIIAHTLGGKLVLYDPITNGIKEFSIPGSPGDSVETFSYTESLVTIKGMEQDI